MTRRKGAGRQVASKGSTPSIRQRGKARASSSSSSPRDKGPRRPGVQTKRTSSAPGAASAVIAAAAAARSQGESPCKTPKSQKNEHPNGHRPFKPGQIDLTEADRNPGGGSPLPRLPERAGNIVGPGHLPAAPREFDRPMPAPAPDVERAPRPATRDRHPIETGRDLTRGDWMGRRRFPERQPQTIGYLEKQAHGGKG